LGESHEIHLYSRKPSISCIQWSCLFRPSICELPRCFFVDICTSNISSNFEVDDVQNRSTKISSIFFT